MTTFRFVVAVMPRAGILDPQGRAVEGSLPHLHATEVHDVRVGRRIELAVDATDAGAARVDRGPPGRRAVRQPAHRGVAGRAAGGAGRMRVGVVVFPGSNCDRDALHGVELAGGEPVALWHEEPDLHGAEVVILPGGFAYGDYLRAGVLARFSPVMQAVRDHAARGGLVLGICNGFQVLAEAGLVPGALLRNASLRFEHRWVRLAVERTDTPFTRAVPPGMTLRLPIAHGEGNFFLPDDELDALEARGGVVFRYARARGQPQRLGARHRRRDRRSAATSAA